WKLQGEVDRWRLANSTVPNMAVALFDRRNLVEPRVFKRGNPANKGDYVSRHFLTRFSEGVPKPFEHGSGRRELAEAITDPNNPLTARVWVNRLWQHHFGVGLVRTPSDFGLRAPTPSHPELLDWLASKLIECDWSTKAIQRIIVNSATYQQSSSRPSSNAIGPKDIETHESQSQSVHQFQQAQFQQAQFQNAQFQQAMKIDPDNRLLWRFSPRRMRLEEVRDSMLAISGDLDLHPIGKSEEMFGAKDTNFRRTVFGLVDRQFLSGTLRIFDFANPDLHIARRSETSIPQQALFLMNHPFVAARARSIVKQINASELPIGSADSVVKLFESILNRPPTVLEMEQATKFLDSNNDIEATTPSKESMAWSYGYGEVDESTGRLKSFTNLTYFASNAWQGGSAYPDKKLGWVQLTATGGHPGNDLQHASVRRWTAPYAMSISIRSIAKHEPTAGDGARFRILHGRLCLLQSKNLHASQANCNIDMLEVEKGDTIDFVVDILQGLNSDQYLWAPEIQSTTSRWNATRDFVGPILPSLTPLEQLAQALLLTNELIFVD
ncbi:MAG: DUF1553 domain-containing protein, partial [Pirellula sp.]